MHLNKYVAKCLDELDVYKRYLLDADAVSLTPTQAKAFKHIGIIRGYLKQGYSDSQILNICKTDPLLSVQERRSRELLSMAYEIFADLRAQNSPTGKKQLYSEQFTEAAQEIKDDIQAARDAGDFKTAASLWKEWRATKKEAAILEDVYQDQEVDADAEKKKSRNVILTVIQNVLPNPEPLDVSYEEAN